MYNNIVKKEEIMLKVTKDNKNTINHLKGSNCYLSGPIEFCNEKLNWRINVINNLQKNFEINVFDPFSDPKQQWSDKIKECKNKKDDKTLSKIARSFVRKDLAMVDRCDFLIAYLPQNTVMAGTIHEIINSNNSKKPTLLVTNGSKFNISSWYYGFIDTNCIFNNWNELYNYLDKVNRGLCKKNDRWSFVYKII